MARAAGFRCLLLILLLFAALGASAGAAERALVARVAAALDKPVPETVDDLLAIEEQIQRVARKAIPATVGVRVGRAQGSGVIVSQDGLVLTAAHVSGEPGRPVTLTLSDGRRVRGESLGLNRELDAGMIRITDSGSWPAAEMAKPDNVDVGDWCVAIGHPGGVQEGRTAPVRLGRIVAFRRSLIQTDCTLVGGDSGGPLFDMQGRVIGVHSRIGPSTAWNFHVPISVYRDGWDKMLAGETWGGFGSGALLGVLGDDDPEGCLVTGVAPGLPAEAAGLEVGDIITHLNGKRIRGFDDLAGQVREHKPGEEVVLQVLRGGERMTITVELADRGSLPIE